MPLPSAGTGRLAAGLAPMLAERPGESAFLPLPGGLDAMLARLALTREAEQSLDLQYYIWRDDFTGQLLMHAVLAAADRGVRVRLLLDDIGASPDDEVLLALASHPGVEVRLFNPLGWRQVPAISLLADLPRINRRMHSKTFLADGQIAVLGGRNIGDEYFDATRDFSFGDLDVLTAGPVVPDVSAAFEAYWQSLRSVPITQLLGRMPDPDLLEALRSRLRTSLAEHRNSAYLQAVGFALSPAGQGKRTYFRGKARLLYDSPEKVAQAPAQLAGSLVEQMEQSLVPLTHELMILSPYFIPGARGVDSFRRLGEQGVQVTVLTNSLASSDVAAVHAGYQRYRMDLLEAGVRLHEMRPLPHSQGTARRAGLPGSSSASLHAKTFVFDRRAVFIGSLNLDPRSIRLNMEIGLLCESPALAQAIAEGVEAQLDAMTWQLQRETDAHGRSRLIWVERNGEQAHRHLTEPETGFWQRLGVRILGWLPIESQL